MCMWCLGTLRNPWATPRCQRPCHRLQYLPCSIHGTGVAPPPRSRGPVARGRGPWRHSISQLVTGKDMSFVCAEAWRTVLSWTPRDPMLSSVNLTATSRGLDLSSSCNPVGRCAFPYPVSPSLFETDHARRCQTGLVQRCSRPHGQPETILYVGCYSGAWLLSASLGSEMKIS